DQLQFEHVLAVGFVPRDFDQDRDRGRPWRRSEQRPAAAQDEELVVDGLGRIGQHHGQFHGIARVRRGSSLCGSPGGAPKGTLGWRDYYGPWPSRRPAFLRSPKPRISTLNSQFWPARRPSSSSG